MGASLLSGFWGEPMAVPRKCPGGWTSGELCGTDTDQWEWKPDLSWNRVLLCGLVGSAGPPRGWPGGIVIHQ